MSIGEQWSNLGRTEQAMVIGFLWWLPMSFFVAGFGHWNWFSVLGAPIVLLYVVWGGLWSVEQVLKKVHR